MPTNECGCNQCTDEQSVSSESNVGRDQSPGGYWLDQGSISGAKLPAAIQHELGRFLGAGSVETISEYVRRFRAKIDQQRVETTDLCHAEEETAHWTTVDGQRQYFQCFYDVILLAVLTDSTVKLHTESPGGDIIEGAVSAGGEISVSPGTAVMSLGIDASSAERVSLETAYGTTCPYVKAFPDRERYEQWAERLSVPTIGTPIASGTELARLFVEPLDDG